jgi:hypothetical protein
MKSNLKSLINLIILLFVVCTFSTPAIMGADIRATLTRPAHLDDDTILYEIKTSRGLQIKANQCLEFIIPKSFQSRKLNYAFIEHRKEQIYFEADERNYDANNAMLELEAFDPKIQKWITWKDQFGLQKRSAIRPPHRPKKNTLYNFPEFVGDFSPTKIRIKNTPQGNPDKAVSSFHKLGLVYLTDADRAPAQSIKKFSTFQQINSLSIRYALNSEKGLELKPNHTFEFEIPQQYQNKHVLYVVLKHRKDPKYAHDQNDFEAFDPNAAYILCELRNKTTQNWHRWADRTSFEKFSEVRPANNPEDETLHNGLRTFGLIYPDKFRLTNVGKGAADKAIANIHELELVFMPSQKGVTFQSEIFTPETAFNSLAEKKPVTLLGGGPRLGGKFPGAILLGKDRLKRQAKIDQLPDKYRFDTLNTISGNKEIDSSGRLHLPLEPGKIFQSIELAIGDLDLTNLSYNKDGYFGRSGKAEASIFLANTLTRESPMPLLEKNNLGMAGYLLCGGPKPDYLIKHGDEIIIQVDSDVAYLMGYRITYK